MIIKWLVLEPLQQYFSKFSEHSKLPGSPIYQVILSPVVSVMELYSMFIITYKGDPHFEQQG